MKGYFLVIFAVSALIFSGCGGKGHGPAGTAASDTGTAVLVFREYEHAFGKVSEGEKVSYTFVFDNRGTSDLVLASATTTCGCTIPEYDRKPIPPGGSGKLEVVFNTAGKSGRQTKTITVKSNAKPPVALLRITAEVEENRQ